MKIIKQTLKNIKINIYLNNFLADLSTLKDNIIYMYT